MTGSVEPVDGPVLDAELARWIADAGRDRSDDVRAAVVRAVTDTVGCMLAGAAEPAAELAARAVAGWSGGPACTVVGGGRPLAAPFAALVNGTAAHALDFDDVLEVAQCHPSAVLVPAVLALAEERDLAGQDVLDAVVAGIEVFARLGELLNPSHYAIGWHATSTLGAPAAAGACARILRLDEQRVRHAVSLATSMAAGLKRQFGTLTKPLHAGIAAQAGIVAARMAEVGITASADIFTAPRGFADCYADRAGAAPPRRQGPAILTYGIWTKAYPSCASTHRPVDAILTWRRDSGLGVGEVDRIVVQMPPWAADNLSYPRPVNADQARFSLHHCLASALVDGHLRLSAFTPDALARPAVRAILSRITLETHDDTSPDNPAMVSVRTRTGDSWSTRVGVPTGAPGNPLSNDQLRDKFTDCATRTLDSARADAVFALCSGLPALPGIRALTHAMVPVTPRPH